MRRRLPRKVRMAGRIGALALVVAVFATIAIQFEGILAKNVALSREISASQAQIDGLRARERQQRRTLLRLSDPLGAIPEIHEKLKLVGPHEEIIYVRGMPTPTPQPETEWPDP